MEQLEQRELIELIKACTQPVLGICLGMQLLASGSDENGGIKTLGIIDTPVQQMSDVGLPLPHMGWNQVSAQAGNHLFRGIDDGTYFLFCPRLCDANMPKHHRPGQLRRAGSPPPCKKTISSACSFIQNVLVRPARNC
ncbi:Imidazole glycerol phosphate synthase subunit HisH [Serratia odorifera]|uniref:Imidazole glycerol phosphate synthase subunit HisH n=1 Tax=Serratia odorifera TaxID=618 RepID=A0A3S4DR68_SEROD|nr:Imidazole glycerol phosphate synthase subunit HisH [Serratia odorifera]